MRLSKKVVDKIRNTPELKREIIYQLAIGEQTFYRYLAKNEENGALTKYKAVKTISEMLGITEDEIFEQLTTIKQ